MTKPIEIGDWIKLTSTPPGLEEVVKKDGNNLQVVAKHVNFTGKTTFLLGNTSQGSKVHSYTNQGGVFTRLAHYENVKVAQIDSDVLHKHAVKVNAPPMPFKVGDLIYVKDEFGSNLSQVVGFDGQILAITNASRDCSTQSDKSIYSKYNCVCSNDTPIAMINYDPKRMQKFEFQVGDIIKLKPSYVDYNWALATNDATEYKIMGIYHDGSLEVCETVEDSNSTKSFPVTVTDPGKTYINYGNFKHRVKFRIYSKDLNHIEKINSPVKFVGSPIVDTKPNVTVSVVGDIVMATAAATAAKMANDKLSEEKASSGINLSKEFESAAYRVGAKQISKASRAFLISLLKTQGFTKKHINVVTDILETEYGHALIAYLLGYFLPKVPNWDQDPRVLRLCDEFRVEGMAIAGDALLTDLFVQFAPILSSLATLPAPDKVRIDIPLEEHIDEELEVIELEKENKL